MSTEPATRRPYAVWLAVAGGVLTVVGSTLTWASVGARRGNPIEADGADLFGLITAVCGLVAVIAGMLLREPGGRRAVLAAAVLAAGLAAAGIGAYVAWSDQVVVDRLAEESGRRLGGRGRRGPGVTPGAGLYAVIAGGVLAAAGGAAGLVSGRRRTSLEATAASVVDASRAGGENTPTPGEERT